MALPGATLLNFDQQPPRSVEYRSLEHTRLTLDFLNHPEPYLRSLTGPDVV